MQALRFFLRARAEIKKLICFASSEQFREYNSRVVSTPYTFRLQQSIDGNPFLQNETENILTLGFHLERTKFFEATLSDTLSRSNQLQSRLMPNDVTFSLHKVTFNFT